MESVRPSSVNAACARRGSCCLFHMSNFATARCATTARRPTESTAGWPGATETAVREACVGRRPFSGKDIVSLAMQLRFSGARTTQALPKRVAPMLPPGPCGPLTIMTSAAPFVAAAKTAPRSPGPWPPPMAARQMTISAPFCRSSAPTRATQRLSDSTLHCGAKPVWKSNIQPDFNVIVCGRFDAGSSAVFQEHDESNRFVQKSAESTSI